jgi:hypothetical protein
MDNQTTLAGVATESTPLFALTVQWYKDACELDEAGSKALHRLERAAYRGAAERVRNMAARLRMEIQANDAAQARAVASRGEAGCSDGCDNSFVSVLWRRLHSDLRRTSGLNDAQMERYFRSIVERTLKEFPPNEELTLRNGGSVQ